MMHRREQDLELGTPAGDATDGDFATVALGDLAAQRQPDADALERVAGMQPLEDVENPLLMALLEADAVVLDDDPALFIFGASPADRRLRSWAKRPNTFTTGGSSARWNFRPLAIRFCNNCRICRGSAWIAGSRPNSTRPPTRSICASRSETTSRATCSRSTTTKSCPWEVTRDSDSRPSISDCIRAAALWIRWKTSFSSSSDWWPNFVCRRSQKERILRSGSCKSWEAT